MKFKRGIILVAIATVLFSCQNDSFDDETETETETGTSTTGLTEADITDWTETSHSKNGTIDYDIVFNQNKVNRIDIVLSASEYASMRSELSTLIGSSGPGGGGPGGGGPGGGATFSDDDPSYVPCDFYFNGKQWYEVGVRYKGNSSLYSAYQSGSGKLPLRLKFDKYEDENPVIKNQRFYGFQHLSLASNYKDNSFMREKSATDLFRAFGVPAVESAYYQVYVDQGTGTPVYYGLYTMDEVVFDTMLEGNCYKPDGDGAKFSKSGFSLADFEKKTNEDEADWSDIQEMYDILHSTTRTTDVEQWKTNLESVFDVDGFMKYLAVNNTILNWDTYANMTHNYYLYHDPADGLIKWIVWDNNEAFNSSGGPSGVVSLSMSEVSTDWPLIAYLSDIDEYMAIYKAYLKDFNDNYYTPSAMTVIYDKWYSLIYDAATTENSRYTTLSGGASSFTSSVSSLKTFVSTRNSAVASYLLK
jgi:spore coat protein H